MNISISGNNNEKNTNGFMNYQDEDFDNIPLMVKDNRLYSACNYKDNYRHGDNFIGNVNLLILDVDDGCTLEQAKTIFKKYKYYIITTRNHMIEKNGIIGQRFRIFLELDTMIDDAIEYKHFLNHIYKKYFFLDQACNDIVRMFYASPKEAKVIYNKEGKLFPTSYIEMPNIPAPAPAPKAMTIIPNQEFKMVRFLGKNVRVILDGGEEDEYTGELDEEAHLKGIQSFLDREYYAGQRAVTLFKASSMMCADNFSEDFIMNYLLREFNARGGDNMRIAVTNIKGAFRYN